MHIIFERLVKAKYTFVKVASLRKKLDDTEVVNRRRGRIDNTITKRMGTKRHTVYEKVILSWPD